MKPLEQALAYLDLGWSVVPIPHGQKHPSIEWKQYQTNPPARGDMEKLFKDTTGMGVVCGAVSGNLLVLDFDTPGAYHHWRNLEPEWACKLPTDRRGDRYHVFACTELREQSRDLYLQGFKGKAGEILAEGKLCVLPPTLHPSGEVRTWVLDPFQQMLHTVELIDLGIQLAPTREREAKTLPSLSGAIPEGSRNESLMSLAASLRNRGFDDRELEVMLHSVNGQQCNPPLPSQEVEHILRWIKQKPVGDYPHPLRTQYREDGGSQTFIPNPTPLGDEDKDRRFEGLFKSCPQYLAEHGAEDFLWVVEGFLPSSYLVVIGGNSKSGKSCFTTALSVAVANGEPFLDMPTVKGAVLWCAYEESEQERTLILKQYTNPPEGLYITHDKLHIDSVDGIEALRYWVRKTGAKLLVIDPLYGSTTAESLSDGRKAREVLTGLKELCRTEQVCAVVLHHFTKNVAAGNSRERFADSNQILAAASMDIRLEATEKPDRTREIKLTGSGRGAFANQTWHVLSSSETDFQLYGVGATSQPDGEFRDETILRCVREAEEPLTADEIARRVNQLSKTVRNRLTELVKDGRLLVSGKFANANLYGIPQKAIDGLEEAG